MNKLIVCIACLLLLGAAFAKDPSAPSTPTLTDAQKIHLLQAYKAEADATIQSLALQLQAAQKLTQQEVQSRQRYFDGALQQTYSEAGVKPEDYTLDMNTLEFKKVEKPEAKEAAKPVAPAPSTEAPKK